jgi:hypothetical protein
MDRRKLLKCAGGGAAVGLLGVTLTAEARPPISEPSRLNAVWVHGTAFEVEDPSTLVGISRRGFGTLFRGKAASFNWFHISIPTPVIIDDVRPTLEKVFVFYKTNGADIRNVHIYDGPRKIKSFDDLRLQGDRIGGLTPANSWSLVPPATILFGLGISLGVQFHVGIDSAVQTEIIFSTAGADFRLPGKRSDVDILTIPPGAKIVNP